MKAINRDERLSRTRRALTADVEGVGSGPSCNTAMGELMSLWTRILGGVGSLAKRVPMQQHIDLLREQHAKDTKRIGELEQEVAALKQEIAQLHSRLPGPEHSIDEDTARVLVHLHRGTGDDLVFDKLARRTQMEPGTLQYHLDQLRERGMARPTRAETWDRSASWGATADGRRFVVENGLN